VGKPNSSAKQKIIIIDDSESRSQLISSLVEECNAKAFIASTAEEARAILRHHDISLIFLDITLHGVPSYNLAEEIHNRPRCRYVPIIFISAPEDDHEQILRTYQFGVIDILKKPVAPELVKSKARVLLKIDSQRRVIEQQQKNLEKALHRLQDYARHDQLTGLFNREQITNILARLVNGSKGKQDTISVLFLDLDNFKIVNDSFGHAVGDLLLRCIALKLKECVRDGDYLARMGGDEFCIVLNNLEPTATTDMIAARILETLAEPHYVQGHEILTSASIGIAHYDGSQKTAVELLKNADAAMYLAKNKGRSQFAHFSKELEQQALARVELASKLKQAIANDELQTYFQPQVSAHTGKISGFEALMRWTVDGKPVSPSCFIPIAEETGLINDLGRWILETATKNFKSLQDQNLVAKDATISVNISSRQLHFEGFLDSLNHTLAQTGLNPSCLELELTETAVMSDPERCVKTFRKVHNLGVKIAVDDFGTGYSSLSYLSILPLDTLKIDRSFVSNMIDEPTNQTIIKSIIHLSHNLNLKVVAEGVETDQQKQLLTTYQCDSMQGYLFGKPLPFDELKSLL